MPFKLDPSSGPGYIQEQLPHLSDEAARMAYWQMRMRDSEMGTDTVTENADVQTAYEQWKTWKALQL
jgi:hypothetical protein